MLHKGGGQINQISYPYVGDNIDRNRKNPLFLLKCTFYEKKNRKIKEEENKKKEIQVVNKIRFWQKKKEKIRKAST